MPGAAVLTIGDVSLTGRILPKRGGLDAPDLPVAIVAGGHGWGTEMPYAGKYASDAGVRLATVLNDVAKIAGELYVAPNDVRLGTWYEWTESTRIATVLARDVLSDLVQIGAIPTWRVAPTGLTRFDAWPSIGAADSFCRITSRDLASGLRSVGLDGVVSAFFPGATLEGVTISSLVIDESSGVLSAEIWDS